VWFETTHRREDRSDVEWLRQGSVRLPPEVKTTKWNPKTCNSWIADAQSLYRKEKAGSQPRGDRAAEKMQKKTEAWQSEQVRRRRVFRGASRQFKLQIDTALDDPEGHESTFISMQAKNHTLRWLWSSKKLKGAVEVQIATPDQSDARFLENDAGQMCDLFVRGNQEQQLYIIEFVKPFTEEFAGELPCKLPKALRPPRSSSAPRWARNNQRWQHSWQGWSTNNGWQAEGAWRSSWASNERWP